MKALVWAFNQEKAIVGAFSVIVKPLFEALLDWAGHGAGVQGEYVRVIGDQRPVFIYLSATVYKSKLMLINVLH